MFKVVSLDIQGLFAVGLFCQRWRQRQSEQTNKEQKVFQGTEIAVLDNARIVGAMSIATIQRPLRISLSKKSVICSARSMLPAKLPST
jgi:hypothetical protein